MTNSKGCGFVRRSDVCTRREPRVGIQDPKRVIASAPAPFVTSKSYALERVSKLCVSAK